MEKIFNTHSHCFYSLEQINEAIANHVDKILLVGYDLKTSLKAIALAEKITNCYASVGFHPSEVGKVSEEDYAKLEQLLTHPKVVALGECGLDYHYEDNPSKEMQISHFERQINLANKYDLPLIVHMRDADNDTYNVLKKNTVKNGIMHCYSGSLELANEFIKLGFYISFAGPLTFNNATNLKRTASALLLEKLLVETDDPYLSPMPFRGQKNRPTHVTLVVKELARLKGISEQECARITYNNAMKLFKI